MKLQLWLYRVAFNTRPFFVVAAQPAEAIAAALRLNNDYLAEQGRPPAIERHLTEFKVESVVDQVAVNP